jgi:hypothetical protein
MRRLIWLALVVVAPATADPRWQGRWEGVADLAGMPMPVILDLETAANGSWQGSVTLPGRALKGAALSELAVDASGLRMKLPSALGNNAEIHLRPAPQGLAGELRQGGHRAALELTRSGPPQVDRGLVGTAVAEALEGTWEGGYELGGYPRQVTLTLSNRPGAAATGTLLIVGRRRSEVPIDLIVQSPHRLRVISSATGVSLEAAWPSADGQLRGQFQQGPLEADFVLKKTAAAR